MSGVAVMSAGEATIGLVPRYLRGKEASINQPWAPEWDQADPDGGESRAAEAAPVMRVTSPTEELRRRIADAAAPERRAPRLLWVAVAGVLVVLTVAFLFPDAFAALLPNVDTSH